MPTLFFRFSEIPVFIIQIKNNKVNLESTNLCSSYFLFDNPDRVPFSSEGGQDQFLTSRIRGVVTQ